MEDPPRTKRKYVRRAPVSTEPREKRVYANRLSGDRHGKLIRERAERMEFALWKKYFGLPKLDPNDKDTKLRRDYIRWFLKLEIRELYYLFRVGPKLLKGIPVAPYVPKLKRRRPRVTVETEDGSTITEL